ncbi:short chain dehydrogenase/reductase [Dendryphion nanum]|uniref:Short chain dehydrogenase/reductase n=1 Tax=Dendryphion nanum TaxID=256645 RepID=A0A9P9DSW8_9PLEO|nr:short chain dehydrogenase/reductase [Dendryphion nanum]
MPYELKGRNVLVTGGSAGLGEVLAYTFARQGCNIAINYFNRVEKAEEVKRGVEELGVKAVVIKADMSVVADCKRTVKEAIEGLGGLDIILANAGWTRFSDFADLEAMAEAEWDKCWAANVKQPHALLSAAKDTFLANPDGGVMITTGSIAGTSQGGSSMPYAVTKAAQIQLVKCLALTQAPKIRVNTVLPGLLLTEWGNKYGPELIEFHKNRNALKHEVFLDDCADAYLLLARNTSMTGVKVTVDSGANIGAA